MFKGKKYVDSAKLIDRSVQYEIADAMDLVVKTIGKAKNEAATELTYTDLTSIADWALEGVHYCTAAKYLSGSNNAFNPNGTATRAMVAQVFMNMAA